MYQQIEDSLLFQFVLRILSLMTRLQVKICIGTQQFLLCFVKLFVIVGGNSKRKDPHLSRASTWVTTNLQLSQTWSLTFSLGKLCWLFVGAALQNLGVTVFRSSSRRLQELHWWTNFKPSCSWRPTSIIWTSGYLATRPSTRCINWVTSQGISTARRKAPQRVHAWIIG